MPGLRDGINTYLDVRLREETSVQTVAGARSTLERFLAYTGNVRIEQLNPQDVWLFFHGEPGRPGITEPHQGRHGTVPGVLGQTANTYVHRMSAFAKFCAAEGWTKHDLMRKMRLANGRFKHFRTTDRDILFLSEAQVREIIAATEWPRDKIMMLVAANTGVRVSELKRFKLRDLNLVDNTITIRRTKQQTKVEDLDDMTMTPELRQAIDNWLVHYAGWMKLSVDELLSRKDWFLLPMHITVPNNHDPKRKHMLAGYKPAVHLSHPERKLRLALDAIGYEVPAGVTLGMHVIRHSVADEWDELYGIEVAQEMLGHKSTDTTRGYLRKNKGRERRNKLLAARPIPAAPGTITHLSERRAAGG